MIFHTSQFNSTIFKQLPTIINDLNLLGGSLNALSTMNIGAFEVNEGNIQAYQSAIKGLSSEQAVFALATKGANAAQIEEIMTTETAALAKGAYTQADIQAALVKNGLAAASGMLSVSQQKELVQSGLLTSEKLAEVAATLGLATAENGSLISKEALNAEMVKQQLESIGVVGAAQSQILTMLGLTTAEGGAVAGTNLLTASFSKLWTAISAHPIGAFITAVGALAVGIVAATSAANKAREETRQASVELTNTYNQEKASLDSQIEKYKELKETLDRGNLSADETRSIKEQLLDIQNSLIDSYGNEVSNIDLVNGKYKEQLGLLSELSKEKATDYVTENRDAFSDAKEALSKTRTYNIGTVTNWSTRAPKTEKQKALIEYIESYSDFLDLSPTETHGGGESLTTMNLSIKADVTSADEVMHQFAEDLEQYGKNNGIDVSGLLEGISSQLKNMWTDELTEYKTIYDEFMKAEIVRNDTLRPLYQQSIQAVEDYNNALSSGKGIEEAKAKLDSVQQSVQNVSGELEGSQDVFNDLYDGINKDAEAAYNLEQALKSNETVQKYAEQLRGISDTELKAINFDDKTTEAGEKALKSLMEALGATEEQVPSLIDKLVELGYIQGKVETSTSDLFSSFNGSEIGERLLSITQQFKDGALTYKEYFDSLRNEIENVDFSIYTDSLEEANSASQQFFTDSIQQTATGLSDLINKFDSGQISITEYLEGYVSIAETLSSLTDSLQENSDSWNKNGEAMDNATSNALDDTQSKLNSAIDTISSYQDSIYSLEQIMTQSVEVGSDEFASHAQVIAEDLYNIVQAGGLMADEVANTLGTTTSEIAQSLTENVSNQSLAAQVITANTNSAITNMATAVGDLFDNLGSAISNFKADITFGVKSITTKEADFGKLGKIPLPAIKFGIEADGESLSAIGSAISSFGQSISSNFTPQMIDMNDFTSENTKSTKKSNHTPINKNTPNNPDTAATANETKETFNWIETALSRIQRKITNFGKTVSATWKSWTDRNTALKDQISAVNRELELQNQARARYEQQANSVALDETTKRLVREGAIDITTVDGNTADLIKEYQEWYEKILECDDAIIDLQDELANLAKMKFDNLSKQFEDQSSLIEHEISMLESVSNLLETRGYMASKSIYNSLLQNKLTQKGIFQSQRNTLMDNLNNSGIKEGTEAWNEMYLKVLKLDEKSLEIDNDIAKLNNNLQELDWEIFDIGQEKISNLADEADFLIELMSNDKLYNNDGSLSAQGQATLGLHAAKYNILMHQADDYAKEMQNIDDKLAKDPNNQNLQNRKQEIREIIQESILGAEDIKQTMKDIISESYDTLLDSMSKVIDKRKDMLSQVKDLHDYEKSIAEQTAEVSKYQKIINSMQGMADTEEGQAMLQKYELSLKEAQENLEETEYDKYISDQEQLLDNLYDEAEEWLNQRLDNLDSIISEVIASTNDNASTIKTTLEEELKAVGGTLTEEMESIWNTGDNSVLSNYKDFGTQITTVSQTLNSIKEFVEKMAKESDEVANETINNATPSTPTPPPATPAPTPPAQPPAPKAITIGGLINAGGAYIYRDSYGGGEKTQYFKSDPIYVVVGEKNGFVLARHHSKSSGNTGWFKKSDVTAYKTGGLVDETGLAWLDGTKGNPEMVLNAKDTENFIALRDALSNLAQNNMLHMIYRNSKLPSFASNATNQNVTAYNGDVHIELPNVTNAQEFAQQFKEIYDKNVGKTRTMLQTDMFSKNNLEYRRYL